MTLITSRLRSDRWRRGFPAAPEGRGGGAGGSCCGAEERITRSLKEPNFPHPYGRGVVNKHNGITEYGYRWSDDRYDTDPRHRSLWVRVVCWPKASGPAQLKNVPFDIGTFSGDTKTVKIGGRQVLTQVGDGALGHGRYAGWVERKGVVVTVMAGRPLVPELAKIIKGIEL